MTHSIVPAKRLEGVTTKFFLNQKATFKSEKVNELPICRYFAIGPLVRLLVV